MSDKPIRVQLIDYTYKPKKAGTAPNLTSWWYAQRGGIAVYIRTEPNGPTVSCTITRRQLETYLAKTARPPEPAAG